MVLMKFRDGTVNVDIREEVEKYDFDNAKFTHNRLISSSPFRDDDAPSFFIDLETGGWGDSGAYTDETKSGNFLELLMRLRGETKAETIEYLFSCYPVMYAIQEGKRIEVEVPELDYGESDIVLEACEDEVKIKPSEMLTKRGISESVQEMFRIGVNEKFPDNTAFPWITRDDIMVNVKYRNDKEKKFFYSKTGLPVNNFLFGTHLPFTEGYVVVVEGEVDAMSLREVGVPAVAVGGSTFNDKQANILKYLPIAEIVLGGDNDKQGDLLNSKIVDRVGEHYEYSIIEYGEHSDANDVLKYEGPGKLREIVEKRFRIPKISLDIKL